MFLDVIVIYVRESSHTLRISIQYATRARAVPLSFREPFDLRFSLRS
jgi:hypothetical protein